MTNSAQKYISSKKVEDETRRLSLMGRLANKDLRKVLEKLKPDVGSVENVLDVGCGTGEAFPVFVEYFPGGKIVGVDTSQKSLDAANQSGIARKLILGDALKLSSLTELQEFIPFDITYIRNALIHIPDIETALTEIKGVTKPGGLVISQEANWKPAEGNFSDFDIFKGSLTEMMQANNINPYVGKILKEVFSKVGFSDIQEVCSHTLIKGEDEEWDIMELLVEVAGERLLPYLHKHNIQSLDEMKQRLRKARDSSNSIFRTPDWVIVSGRVP